MDMDSFYFFGQVCEYDFVSLYKPSGLRLYAMGEKQSIIVPKSSVYDRDLNACFSGEEEVVSQFMMDAIRSEYRIDGRRVKKPSSFPPSDLIKYCTQAVMGIPVMILWQLGIVAEIEDTRKCANKMRVNVRRNGVRVEKRLRIVSVDEEGVVHTIYVADVQIDVDKGTDVVELVFTIHGV